MKNDADSVLCSTKQRLLEYLSYGQLTQKELATKLHRSEATISYHVKRLVKEGKIDEVRSSSKFLSLSKSDSKLEAKSLSKSRIDKEAISPSSKLRLHRCHRSYPLLEQALGKGARRIQLNNNEQEIIEFEGLTLRITTKHIIVEGLVLVGELGIIASQLKLHAEQQADGILLRAMQKHSISADLSKGETKLVEFAITEYDIAKRSGLKGSIPLYWNKITGAVEVWADTSNQPGEWETNKVSHAVKLENLTKAIVEDTWSVEGQLALNRSFMEEQHRFFEKHHALLDEIRLNLQEWRLERQANQEKTKG